MPDDVKREIVGKWTSVFNTDKYSDEEISGFIEQRQWEEFDIIISEDGTASAYYITDGETEIIGNGTWSIQDSELKVTIDGDDEAFSLSDGKLYNENLLDVAWFEKN